MKTKHTPGPWTADIRIGCAAVYQGEKDYGCIENGRKRLAFFDGYKNENGEWKISEEDQANAILIAQAPELLAERDRLREELVDARHDREVAENRYSEADSALFSLKEVNYRLRSINKELAEACKPALSWLSSYPGDGAIKAYNKLREGLSKAESI